MHVVATEIQSNQNQKYSHKLGINVSQISRQPRRRRTIRDHVKNGAKSTALIQETSGVTVDGVKETRNGVEGEEY